MNLRTEYDKIKTEYKNFIQKGMKLDISRGKPGKDQIDYIASFFNQAEKKYDFYSHRTGIDNFDSGNYGLLPGISELRNLFAELLDLSPDNFLIGGNSSLNLMYDVLVINILHGNKHSEKPWSKVANKKFLCPSPGYDRHFMMTEHLDFELVYIPMHIDGPDMDMVEKLVKSDHSIKGIWCTPLYSNPDGYIYSKETCERLARMQAAPDFRIFWDNAYFTHHLIPGKINKTANMIKLCEKYGYPDRTYLFSSTSKISFPGAGVSLIASSKSNVADILEHFKYKIISYDKMNMMRHALVFKNKQDIERHMEELSKFNRPKFETTLQILEKDLSDYAKHIYFTKPEGGYFISFYTMQGCAKRTYELCKQAGLIITTAGDTFPYGKDPYDSNIRIAPTFPPMDELTEAMHLFCCCVKLAILEKLEKI